MQETKITLEPTASMALSLAQGIYEDNALIAQYLNKIDLSSGLPLVERMKSLVKHIIEMLQNRKYFYHQHILDQIRSRQQAAQIIIMGVGYDPISIHLLEAEGHKIESIIEMDMSSFDAKKGIFHAINVPHLEKIKFIQANAVTENVLDILRLHGYDDRKPAMITMEGMMYYLSEEQFIELMKAFRSANKTNSFCIDYIFPWTDAPTEEAQAGHKNGAAAVEKQAGMPLTCYSTERILALIKSLGGTNIKITTQQEIERTRTGSSRCFTQKGEGVFEFITFDI